MPRSLSSLSSSASTVASPSHYSSVRSFQRKPTDSSAYASTSHVNDHRTENPFADDFLFDQRSNQSTLSLNSAASTIQKPSLRIFPASKSSQFNSYDRISRSHSRNDTSSIDSNGAHRVSCSSAAHRLISASTHRSNTMKKVSFGDQYSSYTLKTQIHDQVQLINNKTKHTQDTTEHEPQTVRSNSVCAYA
jgi:hypothetical protein